jgi:hypothetical protein
LSSGHQTILASVVFVGAKMSLVVVNQHFRSAALRRAAGGRIPDQILRGIVCDPGQSPVPIIRRSDRGLFGHRER